jgi:hypothetical protein
MIQATVVDSNQAYQEPYSEPINIPSMDVEPSCEAKKEEDVLTEQFKNLFDAFAEALPNGSQEEKTSKSIFKQFSNYIGSGSFKNDLKEKSEKYGVPAKKLATNFFLKVLGIIGDIAHIAVNTVCSIADTAIYVLSTILHGAVEVINKVANGIASICTFNQTNIKAIAA